MPFSLVHYPSELSSLPSRLGIAIVYPGGLEWFSEKAADIPTMNAQPFKPLTCPLTRFPQELSQGARTQAKGGRCGWCSPTMRRQTMEPKT